MTKANRLYEGAISAALSTSSPSAAENSNTLLAELRLAQADPSWTLTPIQLAAATASLKQLSSDTSLTADQRSALLPCIPIPLSSSSDRAAILDKCVNTVAQLSLTQGIIADRVKLLEDIQKTSDEERQSFRTFWLQIAQMVLMNLFFPLITALLGYIFGTQRANGAG
jgi:hypothetical protein